MLALALMRGGRGLNHRLRLSLALQNLETAVPERLKAHLEQSYIRHCELSANTAGSRLGLVDAK
jgi:hypothetical protein